MEGIGWPLYCTRAGTTMVAAGNADRLREQGRLPRGLVKLLHSEMMLPVLPPRR